MKKVLLGLAIAALAFAVQANIIDDPTFGSVDSVDQNLSNGEEGTGWHMAAGDFRFSSGVATSDRQFGAYYLFQSIDDNGTTTGSQDFSFDFDGSALAWNAAADQIIYDIWGADDTWTGVFNSSGTGAAKTGLTSLLTGTITGFDATPTGTFSTSVDFGAGYNQIIVRMGSNVSGPQTAELDFSDISLGAAVPEPATVGMLGLGSIIAVMIRRIRA